MTLYQFLYLNEGDRQIILCLSDLLSLGDQLNHHSSQQIESGWLIPRGETIYTQLVYFFTVNVVWE